ncbi:unnamed protein product [Ceutorhynchus assimilis]|uniref:U3 small nucleolar RNA-associated protein 6 homolog n=1 Tax=Ceutorhynchus assimilis TaxID=467358 RepID=A0A9N9ME49_9CUCU|nr:unnamed protein product [Ceutorhynchus assimilis]
MENMEGLIMDERVQSIVKKRMAAFETAIIPLVNSKLFDQEEMSKLINKVGLHELKLAALKPGLDDFNSATKYEEGVYFELRRRAKHVHALQDIDQLERIFVKRILATYRKGLKHYPNDYHFNSNCFEFIKRFPDSQILTRQIATNMLELFEYNPEVVRKIASWYFIIGKTENAFCILLRGRDRYPDSMRIYLDLIELEIKLYHEMKLYKEKSNHQTLTLILNRFKTYIDGIVRAKITYRFLKEIILIIENLEPFKGVVDYTIEQIILGYTNEPDAWTFIALRELKGDSYLYDRKRSTPHFYILKAVQRFKDGILMVSPANKPILWRKYLDMLMKVHKEQKSSQTLSLLQDGLEAATRAEIPLQEAHYVAWFECGLNNVVTLIEKMEEGTKKHPSSVLLWSLYLKFYICQDDRNLAAYVFEKAIDALGPKSVKIWEAYYSYHKLGFPPRDIDILFQKVMSQSDQEIVQLFKPRYLDWALESRGVAAARKLYLRLASEPPYIKRLHQTMFRADKMEDIQVLSTPFQEKVLDYWMEQFGAEDVEVHFQKIMHVKQLGGRDVRLKLLTIFDKAIRTLSDPKKISQFRIMIHQNKLFF